MMRYTYHIDIKSQEVVSILDIIFIVKSFSLQHTSPNITVKEVYFLIYPTTSLKIIHLIYFNNTSIKPAVLDGSNKIILADWLNKKSLECTSNNDIPIKIPDYSYV